MQEMSEPLISVVTIFLNPDTRFFEEAIASVFAQTHQNWELLLVDDGSAGESSEIALRWAARHPGRVKYLEHAGHENRGMSAARNLGFRHARGEFVALLDADDLFLPQKLERQAAILREQPEAGMVYGSTPVWYGWTGNPEDAELDWERGLGGFPPDTLVQPPALLPRFLYITAHTPGTCSVLIRREVIERVGGFEETFPGQYEDQAFFSKVCLKVPVYLEGGRWDRYRQHPQSAVSVAVRSGLYHPTRPNPATEFYLEWLEKYLRKEGVTDREVWRALGDAWSRHRTPRRYAARVMLRNGLWRTKSRVRSLFRRVLPSGTYQWLAAQWSKARR
jgi:glycosyltransferase involved in cell wall biosynthesis